MSCIVPYHRSNQLLKTAAIEKPDLAVTRWGSLLLAPGNSGCHSLR